MGAYLLELRERFGEPRVVPLTPSPFWIGRDLENDLVLQDPMVSRRHAYIESKGRDVSIVDNRSLNGVFINQQPIDKRSTLGVDDVVAIGPFELRLTEAATLAGAESQVAQQVDFYEYENQVDPYQTLTTGLKSDRIATRVEASIPWDDLLRLLVGSDTNEFFQAVMRVIENLIEFDRCFLILIREGSLDKLEIAAQHFAHPFVKNLGSDMFVSRGVLRRVVKSHEAVVVSAESPTFCPTESFVDSGASTVMCLPLSTRQQISGAIYVDRLMSNNMFAAGDIGKLAPVASLVALKLDNMRLLEEHVTLKVQNRELEAAQSVQERFLPRRSLELNGYSFHAASRPAQSVGGDCLDLIDRHHSSMVFAVGDVSGKGIAASLYMVGVLSTLRAHLLNGDSLQHAMSRLENYVRNTFKPDDFLTLLLGEIDPQQHRLTFCNAGHHPPVVLGKDEPARELGQQDPAFNVVPWEQFTMYEYQLKPGDTVMAYTDGLVESQDASGELFGLPRMVSVAQQVISDELESIGNMVMNEALHFGVDGLQKDDMAMILIRREEGS